MESMLADLEGVQVYLDDVLVAEQPGTDNLSRVLQRFRDMGVKLRRSKCQFRKPDITYLGHQIDKEGLHPIEKNLEAIRDAPTPSNVQGDSWDLGAPVWVRNFGQGERWSPGTVQNKLGSRMLVIETPGGTVRRHMDQVRGRQGPTESLGGPKNGSDNVGPPVTLGQPDSQGPPSEQDVPAPDGQDQPALRRSTRTRKPIDRLQY
ncbi:uncharacterized protein ISCGN_010472 [Ixodes scapularis]